MSDPTEPTAPVTPPAPPGPPDLPAPAPRATRTWKTWQLAAASGVALLLGLGIGAAGSTSDDEKTATSTTTTATTDAPSTDETEAETTVDEVTTTEAPTTTTAAVSESGSRDRPLAPGTTVALEDWDVTLVSWTPDANAAMNAANSFNDPAPAGQTYALARVRATYKGEGEGSVWMSINLDLVGSDNRSYSANDCGAVEPDPLSDQPSVFADGTVEGNACVLLPVEDRTSVV